MRTITILLLFAVCFFSGVTYGTFANNHTPTQPKEMRVMEEEVFIHEDPPVTETEEIETYHIEDQDYLVNKTASRMEKIVSVFYEIIIEIMYKIANLFFE